MFTLSSTLYDLFGVLLVFIFAIPISFITGAVLSLLSFKHEFMQGAHPLRESIRAFCIQSIDTWAPVERSPDYITSIQQK